MSSATKITPTTTRAHYVAAIRAADALADSLRGMELLDSPGLRPAVRAAQREAWLALEAFDAR